MTGKTFLNISIQVAAGWPGSITQWDCLSPEFIGRVPRVLWVPSKNIQKLGLVTSWEICSNLLENQILVEECSSFIVFCYLII